MNKMLLIGGFAASAAMMVTRAQAATVVASDNGANYTTATWVDQSNGGTGFDPWGFSSTTAPDPRIGDSTNASGSATNIGTSTFELYNPNGNTSFFTTRGFAAGDLTSGETFSADLQVNFRDGLKGLSLSDSNGNNLAGFAVEGGDYYFRGVGSTASPSSDTLLSSSPNSTGNWGYAADTIIHFAATVVGSDLDVTLTRSGDDTASFSTVLTGAGTDVRQLSYYSFSAPNYGEAEAIFANNLQVTATPEPACIGLLAVGSLGLLRRRKA